MIKPKRSLGQNFFINSTLRDKIVSIVADSNPPVVLEIGSGTGNFTKELLKHTKRLIAIEKDNYLASELAADTGSEKFIVFNDDVLELDFNEIINGKNRDFVVAFGSLPYNISKRIISKMVRYDWITQHYYIVQREVAQKYMVKERESNILSLTTQIYADVEILLEISPDSFKPRPKVVSSLIRFRPNLKVHDETKRSKLIQLIKTAFKHPRKTLANNLKDLYATEFIDKGLLARRPSELSLSDYISLLENIQPTKSEETLTLRALRAIDQSTHRRQVRPDTFMSIRREKLFCLSRKNK